MITTSDVILSILSGVLSIIIMRIHDKFYNKQYTKNEYLKVGSLTTISTLCVLYLNGIVTPSLPGGLINNTTSTSSNKLIGGSNGTNSTTNSGNIVTKVTSALNDNLEYFNPGSNSHTMKFKTGTPNF